jgi:hypothetical protein
MVWGALPKDGDAVRMNHAKELCSRPDSWIASGSGRSVSGPVILTLWTPSAAIKSAPLSSLASQVALSGAKAARAARRLVHQTGTMNVRGIGEREMKWRRLALLRSGGCAFQSQIHRMPRRERVRWWPWSPRPCRR